MDATEATPDEPPAARPPAGAGAGISLTTTLAIGATLVLDLVSRFALGDQTLFWPGSAAAVLATASALHDADKARGSNRTAFLAALAAAVLMAASVLLRFAYSDPNIGTPIRVLGAVGIAGAIVAAARWSSLTSDRQQASGD